MIFLANIFGELYFGLFYINPYFDKWIHFFSPIPICLFFYFIFDKKIPNPKILILLSVTLFLSFEFFWEIIEYIFDQNFDTFLQGVHNIGVEKFNPELDMVIPKFEDTIYDMALNLAGSIIFAVGALFAINNKKKNKSAFNFS